MTMVAVRPEVKRAQQEVTVGELGRMVFTDNMDRQFGLPSLDPESVALTFTSPPYWNYIVYGDEPGIGCEESYDKYLVSLGKVFGAVFEKTMPGGRLVVNASNMKSRKSVEGTSFVYPLIADIIRGADDVGFTFFDEIVWVKGGANAGALKGRPLFGSYPYPPTPKILDSIFENILIFTKPGKREKASKAAKETSKLTKQEWAIFTKGIWELAPDHDPVHPATFPMEMAKRIIKMYSFAGDLVLDPFAGTGTSLIAAELNGRASVGFEIAPAYQKTVEDKVRKWLGSMTTPDK